MKIVGLTSHQHRILDRLWSMESTQDIEAWIDTLDESDQLLAHSLAQLLILEHIDGVIDSGSQDYPEVRALLSNL